MMREPDPERQAQHPASTRRVRRVLMTADPVGGVWSYALELAQALRTHGVDVVLATMGAPLSRTQRAAAEQLGNLQIVESRYRLEWMDDPWEDVTAAGTWLLDLEWQVRPDVVHLNGYVHGALPWEAPVLVVGHSCVCSWFEAVRGTPPPARWARYRRAVTRGLQAADLVTAPTEAMRKKLRRHYGPFAEAPVVYNGRVAQAYPPLPKEPFVLSAGRLWDEAKNVAALAEVAPGLPWPVYVAGDAAHPEGGDARFEDLQGLGPLPPAELARWMGRAALFALPARYEPFGLAALEAGLAGCALVLGDLPSLREVWDDCAFFVSPDDPGALEAALQALISDASLREKMAHRTRARALAYSPARQARAYMTLYTHLLERADARRKMRPPHPSPLPPHPAKQR